MYSKKLINLHQKHFQSALDVKYDRRWKHHFKLSLQKTLNRELVVTEQSLIKVKLFSFSCFSEFFNDGRGGTKSWRLFTSKDNQHFYFCYNQHFKGKCSLFTLFWVTIWRLLFVFKVFILGWKIFNFPTYTYIIQVIWMCVLYVDTFTYVSSAKEISFNIILHTFIQLFWCRL